MKPPYDLTKLKLLGLALFIILNLSNCKKLVTVNPPVTSLVGASVYANNATAAAVLTGVYDKMSASPSFATSSLSFSFELGLAADEFQGTSSSLTGSNLQFYQNSSAANTGPNPNWTELYGYLHTINSALEGLSASTSLTVAVKQQLTGEAKFMRAFCTFYLTNLYGDVPLVTTSNFEVNNTLSRTPQSQIYQQIIADLLDAQNLLSANYLAADALSTTVDKVRPTKWAATAMLARVYLYTGDWKNAEAQSTTVINQYNLAALNNVFLKNSTEAIWQLMPVGTSPTSNTLDGYLFILNTAPNLSFPVFLNNNLLNSFEPLDGRRTSWVSSYTSGTQTYYFPFKYKIQAGTGTPTEYLMILRLAEQYLIRAEARAQQNNLTSATADLNVIRNRAGLSNTIATTQTTLLTAILHEREVELFTEWGHRWFDLKRTNNLNTVMGVVTQQKGGVWDTHLQIFPIPVTDIQFDPNLIQNPGY